MKWISEQLVELAKTFHVIVNERDEGMEEQHRILRPELNVFRFVGEMQSCNATEQSECGLASVLRKERAYCKEFSIEKTKAGFGPTNRSVEVVIDDVSEYPQPYSCPRCFYNQCILAFLDRIEYSLAEIELPIGKFPVARLYLVGLIRQEPGSNARRNVVLTLKCKIADKERTFLVAFRGDSVCYMEIALREGSEGSEYDIVQTELRNGLNYDSKISILPVDQIHFVNEDGIIDNFYSINQENIDDAFGIYYLRITNALHHREVIKRRMPPRPVQSIENSQAPPSSHFWEALMSVTGNASFKAAVAISFVWLAVLLLRESQVQAPREKVSIL